MNWDYKLTEKQIDALKYLKEMGGELLQSVADKKIHWLVQHNLYVKLLTSNVAVGGECKMILWKRGYEALEALEAL